MDDAGTKVAIGFLQEQIKELKQELKEMRQDQRAVLEFINESKGGRKWVFAMMTGSAALGGLVDTLLRYARVY